MLKICIACSAIFTMLYFCVTDFVDHRGCLHENGIQTVVYKLSHGLSSCALGSKNLFGYCHQRKVLQRFQLPEVS